MPLIITQPGAAQWQEVPILDDRGRACGTELKAFYDGTEADWAVQRGSQELFLNTKTTEVLYTGNRGGGKTECLLMDFAQHCGRGFGPDWKGILFRHSYPELKDVIDKSQKLFPRIWPGVRYNQSQNIWKWPDGEQLLFRHMEYERDYLSYHGHAYPWIGWEELTTWADSGCFTRMISCCRSANPRVPRKIRATTNPYGPGFNWVKMRYNLPLPPGRIYGEVVIDPEIGIERRAINSDLRENLVLLHSQPNYMQMIKASARNQAELEAWLFGSWDIVAGGMFDDIWFRVRNVLVVPPFQVPNTWRIDRAFDWGSSKPFSVGWWAESDGSSIALPGGRTMGTIRGDLFRIQEWYGWDGKNPNKGIRMLAQDVAKGIIERELKWGIYGRVRRGVADAAIFDDSNGTRRSIADDMSDNVVIENKIYRGVTFDPADKKRGTRKQGWEQMRKLMAAVVPAEGQKVRENKGLFVCENCVQFLRTVPAMPRDMDDLDDIDTEAEDHIADETRYRCRKENREITFGRVRGMN